MIIPYDGLQLDLISIPGDGLPRGTFDSSGALWGCGGDASTGGGAIGKLPAGGGWLRWPVGDDPISSCALSIDGTLWFAGHRARNAGVLGGFDTAAESFVSELDLPWRAEQVAVDFQGRVWGVQPSENSTTLFRVDPATGSSDAVTLGTQALFYGDPIGLELARTAGHAP